jgi:hypothetical protein
MKLSLVYTDLCCQQVFENTSAGLNPRCRSVVNSASCELQVPLTVLLHPVEGRVVRLATRGAQEEFYDKNPQTL